MSQRTKLIIALALSGTFAVVAVPLVRPDVEPAASIEPAIQAPDPESSDAPPPVRLAGASAARLQAQAERWAASPWGRDPFAPPPPPQAPPSDEPETDEVEPTAESEVPAWLETNVVEPLPPPRLTGVSRRGSGQWAIIDRELVRAGDSLTSGWHVTSISGRSVTLTHDEQELTLTLGDRP